MVGAGAGVGIVSDKGNIEMIGCEGYYYLLSDSGGPTFIVEPKVGLSINKHVNISFSYKFQEKTNKMMVLNIGYAFRL